MNHISKFAVTLHSQSWPIVASLWRSGSVRDSELSGQGLSPQHCSHCVIEAGRMCKLMLAVTGGLDE